MDKGYTNKMDSIDTESIYQIVKTAAIIKPGLEDWQVMDAYRTWQNASMPYDEVQQIRGYHGPIKTAQCMANQIGEPEREEYRILDVGAGTGLVGEQLQSFGFTQVDALEPSTELLIRAKDRNVYKDIFQCFMTGKPMPDFQQDMYDGVVTCGCFIENHLSIQSLDEMLRIVKPGGIIIITTRFKFIETVGAYKNNLEPYMTRMGKENKWILKSREVFPRYYMQDDGIVWTFQVL